MELSRHTKEFVCGGGAAVINIIITFPPNKLMFRQQLYGLSVVDSFRSMTQEGWHKLYRGVKPPLVQSAISKSLMFGLYRWFEHALPENTAGKAHIAAFLAGSTEAVLTPLERSQTLLQIPKYNQEISGALDALLHVQRLGWQEHFRGLSAVLMRNGPTNVCFFALREPLKEFFIDHAHETLAHFVSGALLGACLSTLFFPINVARSRMQSRLGGPYLSVPKALLAVYKERKSIRGIYRTYRLEVR